MHQLTGPSDLTLCGRAPRISDAGLLVEPRITVGVLALDARCQDEFLRRMNWHSCNLMAMLQRDRSWYDVSVCSGESRTSGRRYDELHVLLNSADDVSVLVGRAPIADVLHVHQLSVGLPVKWPGARRYQWSSLEEAAHFWATVYVAREHSQLVADLSDDSVEVGDGLIGWGFHASGGDCVKALHASLASLKELERHAIKPSLLIVETANCWSITTLAYVRTWLKSRLGCEPEVRMLTGSDISGCSLTWSGRRSVISELGAPSQTSG
jgi:hypothetical protein